MQLEVFCLFVLSFSSIIDAQSSCGISGKSSGFIVNGTASQQGAWPWIVSIHNSKSDNFLCGGTLIGSTMVVTVSCESV